MNTDILRELGEWAALGFYEGADMPWPRAYGLAMRRLYENMEVCTRLDRLLAPFEPLPHSRTATEHGTWYAEALICDFDHNRGLRVNRDTASRKKSQFPQHANFVEMLTTDLEPRLPHFGGYTHSNPDMRRIVDVGFVAIERELDDELAAVGDEPCSPRDLLLAVKDYAIGVRAFHSRIVEAARDSAVRASGVAAQERSIIACAWDQGAFLKPANSFVAGLLAVNLTWMLDGCDSIGRFDQVLGTLFERDLQCGHLDIELARRLLDELFANFERFNGWNMQIGGYTATGKDGVN